MTPPEAPERPAWVFWSTRESIDNDIPSAMAIAETIVAVPLYWWIAIYFETYLLLLLSAAVAPLVLLRSDQSVALGVKWFMTWEERWDSRWFDTNVDRLILTLGSLLTIVIGLAAFFFSRYFFAELEVAMFWRGFGLGCIAAMFPVAMLLITVGEIRRSSAIAGAIAAAAAAAGVAAASPVQMEWGWQFAVIAGAIAGALISVAVCTAVAIIGVVGAVVGNTESLTAATLGIVFFPLSLGAALGIFVISLLVRIGATTRYLVEGMRSLPRNFRRLTLCVSPRQEPELVPGLPKESYYTLSGIFRSFRTPVPNDFDSRPFALATEGLQALVWFLPGWLYRLTLKSTAWFWWPLAYLGGDIWRAKNPDEFRRGIIGSLWAKTSIGVAVATIVVFAWINIVWDETNPLITAIGYIFLVKSGVPPWQVLTVVLAMLSLAIVFLVDDAGGQYRLATMQNDDALRAHAERKLRWTERLARARLILLVLFLIIAGGQALLYFNSRTCMVDVPASIEQKAQRLYGDRMPSRCATT